MTCAHVLNLIDAGPFAIPAQAHLDAAREHALHCSTCGPAWTMMRDLEVDLRDLGEPVSPPDCRMAVLSRIAEIDAVAARSVQSRVAAGWQRWPAWTGALGGAAAVAAIQSMAGADLTPLTPRSGTITAGLVALPAAQPALVVLVIGLFAYAKGLFSVTASASRARRGAAGDTGSARH
jgi:hypothetical protein